MPASIPLKSLQRESFLLEIRIYSGLLAQLLLEDKVTMIQIIKLADRTLQIFPL